MLKKAGKAVQAAGTKEFSSAAVYVPLDPGMRPESQFCQGNHRKFFAPLVSAKIGRHMVSISAAM
jgi:hypothetical protein